MEKIQKYLNKHQQYIQGIFKSLGNGDTIEATKVFSFIQNSFTKETFTFELKQQNFFQTQENTAEMEKILQSYYQLSQDDQSKKFYLYRIEFTLLEIKYLLEFWLSRQPNLKIVYQESEEKENREGFDEKQEKGDLKEQQNEENQFDVSNEEIPKLIENYTKQISENEELAKRQETTSQQCQKLKRKNEQIEYKIKILQQRLKANPIHLSQNIEQNKNLGDQNSDNSAVEKSRRINYQAIFQFYAKQIHLTGVKATFDRIQHQTQSINYQKLVHFLRQFDLMPSKSSDQKKIHLLYKKSCEKTRDLNLNGFIKVLKGVAEIYFEGKNLEEREELVNQKLFERKIKGLKLLNNPFHSVQKQDFRIKVEDLTYQFKLKAQQGKVPSQIVQQLEFRRKVKKQEKHERDKSRQLKNIKHLKRLQAIDPFNPLVLKNSKLFEQKNQVAPIASLENIEQYRDKSFDFQSFAEKSQISKTPRNVSVKIDHSLDLGKHQNTMKKVEKLERYQVEKMNNIMSGIIERSNAKIQKLGISPKRSIKFQ